ncbi:hypothetical protein [Lacihabitans lacunae]|uniref:Mobilization protein n=1 Tax=Lacihabitans lacunae TaxID=1028214 RepID=A0ABV7Z285_9BACT
MGNIRNYGGRKPLENNKPKSEIIRVRVSKSEKENLQKVLNQIGQKSLSYFIRSVLLKEPIEVSIKNYNLNHALEALDVIEKTGDKLSRSKREGLRESKADIQKIQKEISSIKSIFTGLSKRTILLQDLNKPEKIQQHLYT